MSFKNQHITFLFFLFSLVLTAQYSNVKFENLDRVNGLSSSTCLEIFQDKEGYLWFGTIDGLNKYNGYDFEIFKPILNDSTSISNIRITTIVEDKFDNLWIGTNNGLNILNKKTNKFTRVNIFERVPFVSKTNEVINKLLYDSDNNILWAATNYGVVKIVFEEGSIDADKLNIRHYSNNRFIKRSIDNNIVNVILKDGNNDIWVGTNGKYLNRYNAESDDFDRILIENNKTYELNHIPKKTFIDSDGDFWIGNDLSNLVLWNKKTNKFNHISITDKSTPIFDVYQDKNDLIWISTYGSGLLVYNKKKNKIEQNFVNNPSDLLSLPNNKTSKIFEDNNGVFWIGSYDKGVSKLDPSKNSLGHYYYQSNNPKGLNAQVVQSVLEDSKERIWISTYDGGLNLFDETNHSFKHFVSDPKNKKTLSSNKILYTFEDHNGAIWICTFDKGLNKFNTETYQVERFLHSETDSLSIGQNSVWTGVEDSKNRVWIGLKDGGLNLFNPISKRFHSYKNGFNTSNSLASNFVVSLFVDSKNRLFIGTTLGLNMLDLNEINEFIPKEIDPVEITAKGVNGQRINYITEDYLGNIWLGTDRGVAKLDTSLNLLKSYTTLDGLPNNLVVGLKEDDNKNFWITTKSGLSFLNPISNQFKNFNLNDGIQAAEYQSKSIAKTKDGRIIVGGINGFNLFNPNEIPLESSTALTPRITNFKLDNKQVQIGENVDGRILLKEDISSTENLVLRHNENYISFEFDALYLRNPAHVKYAYMMEGVDEEFVDIGENRVVNHSNLDPGNYVFKVKASINEEWDQSEVAFVNVKILSPFWRTWWAYFIYTFLVVLSVWILMNQYSQNFQKSQEHKLDLMKIQFFINVSHEFRTPLTLILNPIDKILSGLHNSDVVKSSALSAQRSARRLLHLVNQLLDYRKMDAGMAPLLLEKGDVVSFGKDIFLLFKGLAKKKEIAYIFKSSSKEIISLFDFDKLEKIITNLISNAIKFTDNGGEIIVSINLVQPENKNHKGFTLNNTKEKGYVEILVEDNGIGLDTEQMKNVFARFYNLESLNSGTGIGLNFTKGLVEIHKGEISVKRRSIKGTSFRVLLPLGLKGELKKNENVKNDFLINSMNSVEYDMLISSEDKVVEKTKETNPRLLTVLIVEDNRELRAHIKDDLKDFYNIKEAVNGEEGLKMASKYYPDIIVSDVMMPKMDGFDMCRILKKEFDTCHIPVILLTARSREEDLITGYKHGADAYLPKPFKMSILLARIENLLETKERVRQKFSKLGAILPSEKIATNSLDEAFIEKTTKVILDNISDPDFKLENILAAVGVGRSQFFRKIQSITGQNPSNFIRSIRLKYAAELLVNSEYSVKEISHMSGFNSPTYFGKTFRAMYELTPRAYVEKNKQK
jgi:signal transduction histidine kinase/ligand-binding sensor domain-containing protein/DNA-binding NarL/FixJ family response regulator